MATANAGWSGMELKGRVLIYSIIGCPHCLRAKNRLASLSLPYTDVSLDSFPQVRDEVKQRTGGKTTVPQIFFNEVYVGGDSELKELLSDKSRLSGLIEMLKTTSAPPTAPQPPDPKTAVDADKNDGEFICEPDEYSRLVRDMKKANLIKDHRAGLFQYKKSFKGQELVDWLVKEKNLDKERAIEMGQELVSRSFGKGLSTKTHETFCVDSYYRLLEDDESGALNAGATSECAPMAASDLGESMRRLILKIFNKGLSKDGKGVDYKLIASDPDFEKYVTLSAELQRVQLAATSREERLAFFINIYNALVIHGTVKRGPPTNLWQRYKFFNTVSYVIGGECYSLQDIENGVLRGNRKGVGQFSKPFGKNDPRLKVALEEAEPLIHFALNCGAKSCPPIKTFSAKGIKAELKVAAEAFLETDEGVQVDTCRKAVKLSQIFKWYQVDFGGSGQKTVEWLRERMADSGKKTNLGKLIEGGGFSVEYMHYDWGNNSKD